VHGMRLLSHEIWRLYLHQSHRSEGVSTAIPALETIRRYAANEDPPPATANRIN